MPTRSLLPTLIITLAALVAGCSSGEKLVTAKGKLVAKGQPLKVDPKAGMTIVFVPVVEQGQHFDTFPANFNREDSTFTVPGRDGRGIPAGKYKVTLNQLMGGAMPPDVQRMNAVFSTENSAVVRDVKTDDEWIVIDVTKPQG